MNDSDAMEIEVDLPEFTLAEIIKLEKLFKRKREQCMRQEFCEKLAAKFNRSTHRSQVSSINWEQVRNWFQDKQKKSEVASSSAPTIKFASQKTAIIKKRVQAQTISVAEAADQLSELMFEARSAKDHAWFDVGSFLNYRVLYSGELLVRVRFAGFGKEEDEWVSVKRAVRERSIPLEHSECDKVNIGDLVLCYREAEHNDLYCDAHVIEVVRQSHDLDFCTCIFAVRYDYDNVEDKVGIKKLCRRPVQSQSMGSKLVPKEIEWYVEDIRSIRSPKDE